MSSQAITSKAHNNITKMSGSKHEIDLVVLIGTLLERKWFIGMLTLLFTAVGVSYSELSTPIYRATAMVQVEERGGAVPGFDDLSGIFEQTSAAVTEIELLKSRSVIGEAVDNLKLDVLAVPKLFPVLGGKAFRNFKETEDIPLAEPKFGADIYAWGGEHIDIFNLEVSEHWLEQKLVLKSTGKDMYDLFDSKGHKILSGKVGYHAEENGISITVKALKARTGTEFLLVKNNRLNTILRLQKLINASEKGKDSGIINLSFENESPYHAQKVLDMVASIYVKRNIERSSAEAQKSLEFLKVHLPDVKKQLESAENRLNEYQVKQQSVNISLETQGILQQVVELDTKLQELELEQLELGRRFKSEHPSIKGVLQQIKVVNEQRRKLTNQVGELPETQQELLRLTRDVEVNNEIYTLLLAKTQELDIMRAGTIGNVRIIDVAAVDTSKPVKPKKIVIIVLSSVLGALIAFFIVLVQKALFRGLEEPKEIEALDVPVYATVPFSDYQEKTTRFSKLKASKKLTESILAIDNPADISIESLRSLRTSIHFAMMDAVNNIVSISGPSPGVGKSFISANLSIILAQSGKKVLLVDADMRKGHLHKSFMMKGELGLSDVLSGQNEVEDVLKASKQENLTIITRGQVPPNPSELLMSARFSKLIKIIKERYDIVIIDTPPLLAVTDPAIVASHTGTTLVVARYAQTQIKELDLTINRFLQNGTKVKGVVFNGVQRKANGYYGYYGYYNYEYRSDTKS
ncbi:MAG: polysaccharide biosynthesis tyrosine autokinase [Alteromonadaceae bacterium]|nr:polysaccharide biosynthesis tyrosine autokinase [Alteromonadaceae bacterium]